MANQQKNILNGYVEVNVRIEKFYEKYPNGRILTEIISWENGVVVMKATVYRDQVDTNASASGHAYEKEGSTFINKTSALENCETSAVGRALAILGFEIKKSVASKEEVENAKLNQNKPEQQESKRSILIAKWKTLWGTDEKFDEWYTSQETKGFNENQMEGYLTKRLMAKKQGA